MTTRLLFSAAISALIAICAASATAAPTFPGAGGNYSGLAVPVDENDVGAVAILNIDMTDSGALSGSINRVGFRRALKGKFDPATRRFEQRLPFGVYIVDDGFGTITKEKAFLIVRCELDPTVRTISGVVEYHIESGPLPEDRHSEFVLSGTPADTELGDDLAGQIQQSFIDPPDTGDEQEIPGDGFANVKVGKNKLRSARIVGKLPDSGTYSAGTPLKGNRYSLMSPVYQDAGRVSIIGNKRVKVLSGVTFGTADVSLDTNSKPRIDAPLKWVKAPGLESNYYSRGFKQLVSILTNPYPKLKKGALVPIGVEKGRAENAVLTLNRGNMDGKIEVGVTMTPGSAKVVRTITPGATEANPYKVKLKANALLGTFSGSFVHPVSGEKTKFSGAFRAMDGLVLGEGRGSFRGSIDTRGPAPLPLVESGSVRITVNP